VSRRQRSPHEPRSLGTRHHRLDALPDAGTGGIRRDEVDRDVVVCRGSGFDRVVERQDSAGCAAHSAGHFKGCDVDESTPGIRWRRRPPAANS
jgi:hypothetical protein